MNRDDLVKFLEKQFDRMFEGLAWVVGIGIVLLLIFVIILFAIVAPYVVCIIIGFWVLCYIVGFIREKISEGCFNSTLGWSARNVKDKIKRWRTAAFKKLKSVTTSYLKPLKDLLSFTKNDWK